MGNIIENGSEWANVRQLETTDPAVAGPGGIMNQQAIALMKRGNHLRDRVSILETGQSAGMVGFASKAEMDADLSHPDKAVAVVTNDATAANNGAYRKIGAPGSGSWVKSADRVSGVEGRVAAEEVKSNRVDFDLARVRSFVSHALTLTQNSFWAYSTGVLTSFAADFRSADAVAVSAGMVVKVTAKVEGALTALAVFKKADGSFHSYVNRGVDGAPVTYVDEPLTVPDGATLICVTSYQSNPAIKLLTIDAAIAGIPARVDGIDANLGSATADISKLRSYMSEALTVTVNRYWRYSNGEFVTNGNDWRSADQLAVFAGETVKITANVYGTDVALAVFKKADGSFHSNVTRGTASATAFTDQDVVVPAGAAFLCVTSYQSAPVVKRFKVDPNFSTNVSAPVARLRSIADRWSGKKIAWFGTSIPAGTTTNANSYPAKVAAMLGSSVVNQAVGSSIIRAGIYANKNAGAGDPLGWTGMNYDNLSRALSHTAAEKDDLINNWAGKWYALLTGSRPATLDAPTQALIRGYGYEQRLVPHLDADLFLFDHFHNDAAVAPGGYSGSELTSYAVSTRDRTTAYGACNSLIDIILATNPKARIAFVGHYEDDRKTQISQAQKAIAEFWGFPILPLWDRAGWSQQAITGAGASAGKTITQVWMPDNLHPHSDATGAANDHLAKIIAGWLATEV